MYNRRVLAGEFTIVNKYLLNDLTEMGLWTSSVRNKIIADGGSIQQVPEIPKKVKDLYKTVWEIPQKCILDMAADRGAYICQSQSLNIHIAQPTTGKLTSMHFYAWKKGLKTGMYYLRTQPKAAAIQFTVDQEALSVTNKTNETNNANTAATLLRKDSMEQKENAAASTNGTEKAASVANMPDTKGLQVQDDDDICLSCGA